MLTFAHPWMLWLGLLPLVVRWILPPLSRTQPAVRVPFLPRLHAAGGEASGDTRRERLSELLVHGVVWLLVLAALARPQRLQPPVERGVPTRDLLLLVDLSGSMEHKDFTSSEGDNVNRLEAVKEVLGEFLSRREGDRVGLVVFGNSPYLQVPFTTDLALCRQLLDETAVGMAGPKTALGDAIGLGIRLFENSDAPTKTLIALTDGNDTSSSVPPAEAARIAADRDITIHTVAIGDPTTVGEEQLDQESLKAVAQTTDGDYFLGMNRDELAGIYARIDEMETREVKTVSHRPRCDLYYWPMATALLLSIGAQGWTIWATRSVGQLDTSAIRLRVNPRTFELEAIDK